MTYRPRGVFARALYDKVNNDQYIEGYDMKLVNFVDDKINKKSKQMEQKKCSIVITVLQWYKLPKELPEKYQSKFVQLEAPDEITKHWLDQAKVLSANLWLQIWHIVARLFLATFMTQTDVNG